MYILDSMTIEEIHFQTIEMKKYAQMYNDYTIMDGTFKVCKYQFVLIVFTNVDCLGKYFILKYIR